MKQTLLSFTYLFFCIQLTAQVSLSISPDLVQVTVDPMQFETVAHSYFHNTSETDTLTVRWSRIQNDLSPMWQSAICDVNACYATTQDSTPEVNYLVLAPGDSSMLDVHIRPNGMDGSAEVKVAIEEVGNPDNRVEATYVFNDATTPTSDVSQTFSASIFPNPAVDYFQLSEYEGVARVTIYNLAGSEVRSFFNTQSGTKFDVSGLQRGLYLVKVMNVRQDVLTTLRLNKR